MTLTVLSLLTPSAQAGVGYTMPPPYVDPCSYLVNGEYNPGCEPTEPELPGGGGSTGGGSNGGGSGSGGSGTGTGGSGSSNPNFTLWQPDTTYTNTFDLEELDDCFEMTNNSNHTHTVTIFVDQPVANSDDLIDSNHNVGHVWIGIEQSTPSGQSTFKNLGLYPATSNSIDGAGRLGTETMKPFDVSVTYSISPTEFRNLVQYVQNKGVPDYNFYTYNCTDYALDIVNTLGFAALDAEKYINTMTAFGYLHVSAPGPLAEDVRANPPLDAEAINTTGGFGLGNPPCVDEAVQERN